MLEGVQALLLLKIDLKKLENNFTMVINCCAVLYHVHVCALTLFLKISYMSTDRKGFMLE